MEKGEKNQKQPTIKPGMYSLNINKSGNIELNKLVFSEKKYEKNTSEGVLDFFSFGLDSL